MKMENILYPNMKEKKGINYLFNIFNFIYLVLKKRMDLTNEIICTIDPATAKDLDDALSIKKISDDICNIHSF